MSRFDVVVYRRVVQYTEVVVDAESEEEARAKAAEAAKARSADQWQVEYDLNDGAYEFNVSVM
jgi:hypothetical protein